MRRLAATVLLLALAALPGCGAVMARSTTGKVRPVFPGVCLDAEAVGECFGRSPMLPVLVLPLAVLDMPLSACVDVVLLPFDLIRHGTGGPSRAVLDDRDDEAPRREGEGPR